MIELIKSAARYLRRFGGLSPIQAVFRKLRARGIATHDLNVLEMFGGVGLNHTIDYYKEVKSIEVWENDKRVETALRKNLKGALIKITDAFTEVNIVKNKFDLVILDAPGGVFADYCEHFELFPKVLDITSSSSIIILNVIPTLNQKNKIKYPYMFDEKHLKCRDEFYQTGQPENIGFDEFVNTYSLKANQKGYTVDWFFFERRTFIYYLVLKLSRSPISS